MTYKLSKWQLTYFHNRGIFVCCRCGKKLELGDLIEAKGHFINDNYLGRRYGRSISTKRVYHKACWDSLFFEAPKASLKQGRRC